MSAPNLHTEANLAGNYPQNRFNQRERKLLQSVSEAMAAKSIVAAGTATSAGGAAAEDFTISGVLATDTCIVTLNDQGTNVVTMLAAIPAAGKITVTFSADPGADAVISYMIIR